jgi:hypothetical protein
MKSTQMVRLSPHLPCIVQFSAHNNVEPAEAGQKEIFTSWALFILIMLLITALFTSYLLQQKKIQAVHETVISIFAGMDLLSQRGKGSRSNTAPGMVVGLIIRVTPGRSIQDSVSFDYQFFFNLLLPPIILASGYELHQVRYLEEREMETRYPVGLIWDRQTSFATLALFLHSRLPVHLFLLSS